MYETYWGLEQSPFSATPDLKYFYESPTHREALARLHFLVENDRRLGLLLGASGSGKSLLLEFFARELSRTGKQVAKIDLLGMTADEFPAALADCLGLSPGKSQGGYRLWRTITDRLTENGYQRISTVVLLDDADQASEATLQQVLRLLNLQPSSPAKLAVVLAAQPRSVDKIGRALLELAELRIDLDPLDREQTGDFLAACVNKAGRQTPVFDDPATDLLHDLTHGIPRQISQLAELALLAGAGQQLSKIDQETVESVYRELKVAAQSR